MTTGESRQAPALFKCVAVLSRHFAHLPKGHTYLYECRPPGAGSIHDGFILRAASKLLIDHGPCMHFPTPPTSYSTNCLTTAGSSVWCFLFSNSLKIKNIPSQILGITTHTNTGNCSHRTTRHWGWLELGFPERTRAERQSRRQIVRTTPTSLNLTILILNLYCTNVRKMFNWRQI